MGRARPSASSTNRISISALVQAYQKLFSLSSGSAAARHRWLRSRRSARCRYRGLSRRGRSRRGCSRRSGQSLHRQYQRPLHRHSPTARPLVDPLYMAALRAVEDNQASVLSVSFGSCEGFMLQSGNALWSALWQQAAAQGQTVLVSSGDSGSAGCDDANDQWTTEYGLAVNGLASTPWNIAVGGTDFYYSDYATGGASIASLWNQTNDANNGSLKAPLPEQVWDTVYGLNAIGPYQQVSTVCHPRRRRAEPAVASTPPSSRRAAVCHSACNAVPRALLRLRQARLAIRNRRSHRRRARSSRRVALCGRRHQPQRLSHLRPVPVTAWPDSNGVEHVTLVGGTSASTPAMAAIMALVNQKYGRQGQADFTLYPLARQLPSAFHDVTLGSNNMTCVKGLAQAAFLDTNGDGFYSLQKYSASARLRSRQRPGICRRQRAGQQLEFHHLQADHNHSRKSLPPPPRSCIADHLHHRRQVLLRRWNSAGQRHHSGRPDVSRGSACSASSS